MARNRIDCALEGQLVVMWLVLIGWGFVTVGCQPQNPMVGAGLDVHPPATWKGSSLQFRPVPGSPIAAWTGPQGSSLVIYRALPIPGGTPESIAATLANRLTNLPGLEIKSQRVQIVDERPVARVEIVGPGTGDSLAPSSIGKPMAPTGKTLIPTRELILGLPGPDETLYLSWGIPESGRDQLLPEIEATISSLRLPRASNTSTTHHY